MTDNLPIPTDDTTNPCPPGWRVVQDGERIADPHAMIGAVVGRLRQDGIETDQSFEDDAVRAELLAAMTEVLNLLDVRSEPQMKYEAYFVA